MAKILMVMPIAPYPPRSDGITIRINPIFEYLCDHHQVDAIVACDGRPSANTNAKITRARCNTLIEFPPPQTPFFRRKLRILKGLFFPHRAPFTLLREWSTELAKLVKARADKVTYDAILWIALSDAASEFLYIHPNNRTRVIIDWIDSPSLHYERFSRASNGGELTWFKKYRLHTYKRWEHSINLHIDAAIYITKTDLKYANQDKIKYLNVIPNGIFEDLPEIIKEKDWNPQTAKLGFLGNMAYQPNIQAALRLHRIFTSLIPDTPQLKLKIIGRAPDSSISALASSNVEITGRVDSIWPDVFDVDIFVFPLSMGAGLQNKVLEAMRAGKPIVTTSACVSGLEEQGQGSILKADTDEEIRNSILHLLNSETLRREYGQRSAAFVKRYNWQNILPHYEQVLFS